ncbi:MAG: TonB-dependent receptor [Chitinophagaceae bacterium]|nr:TonB-dependent receptor [Chitinophagaceae bacterium]
MRKLSLLLSFMLIGLLLQAQKNYTVKVTDSKTRNPITNASVNIKSTSKGAVTNTSGSAVVQALPGDVLEITSIGYASQNVTLSAQTSVSVVLESTSIEYIDVVVVGSRGAPRAKTETAVPVDVIRINQVGLPTAKMDLTSALNMAAPSFNYNKQTGADGADHVDLGTLRGLGPDQTLVLINGKRRHQTAFVALFGTRGRGNSGADLNAFPQSAVDRIEILRDGASAQYGSDAMAGVMNIVLKRDINKWSINTGWAGYYDTKFNTAGFNEGNQYVSGKKIDGGTFSFSANGGVALGKNGGFINVSMDLLTHGKTYRQSDTTNWQTDKNALPYINPYRRAFGDGSIDTYGAMYNMEIPTSAKGKTIFYSFGGYNYKASDAYAYSRNWSARPQRFPVDANGDILYDPNIMRTTSDGEIYYNPHIQTKIKDFSIAAGVKGTCHNWNWDISNTVGKNDFHYYGDKTFNASVFMTPGTPRQTHFDDGGFNFLQNTLNLDLSRSFSSIAQGLNLGLGAEYRYEHYGIYAGEETSYKSYFTGDLFYPNVNESRAPAAGAQGFPGFTPSDAIKAHRSNISIYADGELNITKAWLADAAIRFENYSDFGSVLTFKFATRYKVASNFNIRGSVSTGFRAPSLQQINFSNTLTSFSGGNLVNALFARNGSAITKAAGIPDLKEETSVNGSLGFAWKPMPGLSFTMDGYIVKVKDRIVLSGLFSASDPTLPPSFTSQIPADVATVQFFANAVNTTNYGIDIVADYSKKWGNNNIKVLLAGNFQKMKVDKINVPSALNGTVLNQKTFFSDREEAFLLASAPNTKFNVSLQYSLKKFGVGANLSYFGKIKLMGFGDATADNPNQTGINPQVPTDADPNVYVSEHFNFKGKLVTDLFASYNITKKIAVFIGVDNIFNIHPDLGVNPQAKGWFGDNESGGPWDSVQMGFNGRKLFTKLSFNF